MRGILTSFLQRRMKMKSGTVELRRGRLCAMQIPTGGHVEFDRANLGLFLHTPCVGYSCREKASLRPRPFPRRRVHHPLRRSLDVVRHALSAATAASVVRHQNPMLVARRSEVLCV